MARFCPADVHKTIDHIDQVDSTSVKQVVSYLVAAAPMALQKKLIERFNINLALVNSDVFYNGLVRSTLRDVLISEKDLIQNQNGIGIDQTLRLLEEKIQNILNSVDKSQLPLALTALLAPIFKQNRLPEPLKNLPESLVEGKRHVGARQKRRRMQLKYRVQQHPIIFLQGEACAGKTFMAKAVASDIHHDKPAKIIQLGPNTKAGELFGSQKLMSYCIKTGEDDQRTEFCNGPILEWACSENPPLLILDEANLAPQGLLAPLIGLTQDPPILHYRGRHYPLTEKHRVIMTGNPDSYQGRGLDQLLHGNVPTLFYHPLTDDELADNIILPKLPASLSEPMKKLACQRLLTLFNQFKIITTDNLITPRDIIDVLSLINLIERCQTTKTDWNEAK